MGEGTQYLLGLTQLFGHGRAFTETLSVTKPAAGAGFTYTNDGNYWELLDSLSFQIVTDGNAANRQPTLTIKDGGGVALATLPTASVQTASLTWQYTFSPSFDSFNTVVALAVTAPLPRIFLRPQYTVTLAIGAVQVTDQVSNIRLDAQRFVTGPQGYRIGMVDEASRREEALIRLSELLA